jgi:hypothetical protein
MGNCPCETLSIRTCAPYANAEDVAALLASTCVECVAVVPAGTASSLFCAEFGGAKDDCCELLIVFEGERIWFSTDCSTWYQSGCDTCYFEVGIGDAQNTWCTLAEATGIDTDCCKPMFFYDTVDIWLTNDCTTFQNLTTRTPAALDVFSISSDAGGATLVADSTWRVWPFQADVPIAMIKPGFIVAHMNVLGPNCAFSFRMYATTRSAWFTNNGYYPVTGLSSGKHSMSAVDYVPTPGTFYVRPHYYMGTGCGTNTVKSWYLTIHAIYED